MRSNAWVARIHEDGRLFGWAGSAVEVMDDAVAEGAWTGDLSAGGLLSSTFRCGSAVVVDGKEIVVLPPSHSLEGIYAFQTSSAILLSNSIQALIASEPTAQPSDLGKLRRAVRTLTKGKLGYERVLYETDAGRVLRFAFSPVRVARKGLLLREQIELTRGPGKFSGFDQYKDYLRGILEGLLDNGRHVNRQRPYRSLVTTCSGGYDSAACAGLAAEVGCDLAVTVRTARGGREDSGKAIAESLGIPCLEFERACADVEERLEGSVNATVHVDKVGPGFSDFFASAGTAEDFYFAPFEPHIARSFLLTGFHGDKVWARGCPSGEMIERGDASGSGLDEFRKRVSFVHVPVPYIGAEAAGDLARIGSSENMQPWRRDGATYNRPLPRRLAEEAGVPRELFGYSKAAASVLLRHAVEARNNAFNGLVEEYRHAINAARQWEM